MINPASVAFDIDDVFADTMDLFLEIARSDYDLNGVYPENITSYMVEDCVEIDRAVLESIFNRIVEGRFSSPLKALEGAPEVIARVAQRHSPVLFVTARPRMDAIVEWIRDILPLDPSCIDVVATGSFEGKVDVLLERKVSHFVDDRLETCFSLNSAGITPILFKRPWNRTAHPFTEVGSWRELESLIQFNGVESK